MKLLPCPFCSGTKIEFERFNLVENYSQDTEQCAMICQTCGAQGGPVDVYITYGDNPTNYESYKEETIELWNKRPLNDIRKMKLINLEE